MKTIDRRSPVSLLRCDVVSARDLFVVVKTSFGLRTERSTPLLILKRSPTTIRKSCFSQWSVSPIRLEQEYHPTWQEQNLLGLL